MILYISEVIFLLTRLRDNLNQSWCYPEENTCEISNGTIFCKKLFDLLVVKNTFRKPICKKQEKLKYIMLKICFDNLFLILEMESKITMTNKKSEKKYQENIINHIKNFFKQRKSTFKYNTTYYDIRAKKKWIIFHDIAFNFNLNDLKNTLNLINPDIQMNKTDNECFGKDNSVSFGVNKNNSKGVNTYLYFLMYEINTYKNEFYNGFDKYDKKLEEITNSNFKKSTDISELIYIYQHDISEPYEKWCVSIDEIIKYYKDFYQQNDFTKVSDVNVFTKEVDNPIKIYTEEKEKCILFFKINKDKIHNDFCSLFPNIEKKPLENYK